MKQKDSKLELCSVHHCALCILCVHYSVIATLVLCSWVASKAMVYKSPWKSVAATLVQEDPLLGVVKLPLPPWRRKAAPKAGYDVICDEPHSTLAQRQIWPQASQREKLHHDQEMLKPGCAGHDTTKASMASSLRLDHRSSN